MTLIRLPLLLLCLAATAAAPAAQPFEQRVDALLGYWFSPARDAAEARVLHITNVVFTEPDFAVMAGRYGPAGAARWADAQELTARARKEHIELDVVSVDGARLRLVATPGGALQTVGEPVLNFARSSLSEIQRFVALNPAPRARAGSRSTIELVYIGADDCSMCRRWEADNLGPGRLESSSDWQHLRFTEVKLATLSAPFRREDLPPRLRPRFDILMADGLRIHGVPSFVLLVNEELRAHALGPAAFESFVYIALRTAVQEKLARP